ncbi:hypothetical protein H0H87_007940 [Tephrocybe sp. NHM501043]|nr:hypothetical protein H0H87_007940 [Tephrocybe sp. NHM501043]
MSPSGYVQVSSPQQKRKGILRPGAAHLCLPLVERHSRAYNDSEESLLTLASSHLTISAAPKSSASLYSQASYYATPPPVLSEDKVDRRRFAIVNTPAQDGPWSRPAQLESPIMNTFVLDLKSATLSSNPFIGEDDDALEMEMEEKQAGCDTMVELDVKNAQQGLEMADTSKEATKERTKKLRLSTKGLGKMLSRLSIYQSPSRRVNADESPLLPVQPPQILVSLPSPELKVPNTPKEDNIIQDDLRSFVLEKNADIPRSRAMMSAWKPRRPPSPLPKSLRRYGKHTSDASALAHLVITSPPPPLPVRRRIQSTVLLDAPKDPFLKFSTPLSSAAEMSDLNTSPSWADIQMSLKARASKSSTYAVHGGGIFSPTRL